MRGLLPVFWLVCAALLLTARPHAGYAQAGQPWVATTDTHTAVVHANGTLWSWGLNSNGQVGDGSTIDQLTPVQVGTDSTWQQVAVSSGNTYALRRDGSLWSWGANRDGQLGTGATGADQPLPARVGSGTAWVSVTAGEGFALALQRDGSLWAWGTNFEGQLGDGSTTPHASPARVVGATPWRQVTAGAYHVVAVKQDGTLWVWGYNGQGQLGNGQQTGINHGDVPTPLPQQVGTAHSWVSGAASVYNSGGVQQDGSVWSWGYGYFVGSGLSSQLTPQPVALPTPARSLVLSWHTTLIVACDGTLWGYGNPFYGELGDGTYASHETPSLLTADRTWTQVVMGQQHAVALQPDGSVWAWGANEVGALGHPSLATFAIFAPRQAVPATSWAQVSAGTFHTLAVQRDGSLWSWGQNSWGEAGDGTTTPRRVPAQVGTATTWQTVAAGNSHSLALRRDGTLWAWGVNGQGQLGDGTTDFRVSPQQVGSASTWTSIVAGNSHSAALQQDGTLWVWGANTYGQLGLGLATSQRQLVPQAVGTDRWRSVAVGVFHTLAVRADSTLWAWGDNTYGQLGVGTSGGQQATPVQVGQRHDWVSVGAGVQHSLAIRGDGTLWAWGDNRTAQLGLGLQSNLPVVTPTQVGTGREWVAIGGGTGQSSGLQRDGSLWTWGWGYSSPWTRLNTYYSVVPQLVAGGQAWTTLSSGWATVLAVRPDGTLWGWGSNVTGNAGTPSYALAPLLIQAGSGLHLDRLQVYPNPARGAVTIIAPGCSAPLRLFDLTGRHVRTLPPCTKTLDVQGLASGVYVLRQGAAATRLAVE